MPNFDASVKFDSKQAEANVTSFSNKIGNLSSRLKTVGGDAGKLGNSLKSASTSMSETDRRTKSLDTSLTKVSKSATEAATRLGNVGKAINSPELTRASGLIKNLANDMTRVSGRMKQMRTDSAALAPLLLKLGSHATTAAVGLSRLEKSLRTIGPPLMGVTRWLSALTGALRAGEGRYTVTIRAVDDLKRSQDRGREASRQYGHQMATTSNQILGMGVAAARARNFVIFLAGGLGVREIVEAADSYKLLSARLATVVDGAGEVTAAYDAILESSNRTRTSLDTNARMFTRLMIAGEQYGMSAEESLRITENVNKALVISGASAGEATAATLQLSQAFASGRIQGDELRSVLENAPVIAQALASKLGHLGITMQNLRQAAKEGKIGIDELRLVLGGGDFTAELEAQFAKIPVTIGQSIQIAINNLTDFIGRFDAASGITGALSRGIVFLSENLDTLSKIASALSVVLAVRLTAGLISTAASSNVATAAMLALQARMAGTASTATALSFVGAELAATMGGGLTIGLTLAAGAMAYWMIKSSEAEAYTKDLNTKLSDQVTNLGIVKDALAQTASQQDGLTGALNQSSYALFNITTAYDTAAASARGLAVSARAARMELLRTSIAETQSARSQLKREDFFAADSSAANLLRGRELDPSDPRERGILEGYRNRRESIGYLQTLQNAQEAELQGLRATSDTAYSDALARNAARVSGNTPRPSMEDNDNDAGSGRSSGRERAPKEEVDRSADAFRRLSATLSESERTSQTFREGVEVLNAALANGHIDATTYNRVLQDLGRNTFPGLASQMRDLSKANEELQWRADGADDAEVSFRQATRDAEEQLGVINQIIAAGGDHEGTLARQRDSIVQQLRDYGSLLQVNKELNATVDARAEQERQITRLIDESSDRLYEMLTSRVSSALTFSGNLFKDFFKSVLSMARDTVSSVLGAYVFEPIREQFRNTLRGAFGLGSNGSSGEPAAPTTGSVKLGTLVDETVARVAGNSGSSSPSTSSSPSASGNVAANDNSGDVIVVTPQRGNFFEEMAGGYRDTFRDIADELGGVFKPIASKLGLNGKVLGDAGKMFGKAIGGAQTGMMVAGLGKALGLKTSTTGGAVGGAIGSALPIPGGELIGSVIGSMLGGALKKTPKATVSMGTTVGGGYNVGDAVGSESLKETVSALGSAVRGTIENIAGSLGGNIKGGLDLGSIGQRGSKFTFDPSGKGLTKGGGVLKFKTEEEAIAAAVKNALKNGVVAGLSETGNKVLQSVADTERAVQLVQTLEDIKRRADMIRDPLSGSFKAMQSNFEKVTSMFTEMGASAGDWADLQLVMKDEFKNTLSSMVDSLKAFRDDLIGGSRSYKSPYEKLNIASASFSAIEGKLASGQYVSQDEFINSGSNLQDLAREVWGSTPEFAAIQQRIIEATNKLINNAETQADAYQPVVDALVASSQNQIAATNVSNALLETIANRLSSTGLDSTAANGYTKNKKNKASF